MFKKKEKKGIRKRSAASQNGLVFFLNLGISAAFLLLITTGIGLFVGKQYFEAAGPLAQKKTILVATGESLSPIARKLEREGAIQFSEAFQLGVRAYGNATSLKAGEYELEENISMRAIMEKLVSGKSVQYSVSVPEGLTTKQAYARIAENKILTGDLPLLVDEGALLPDTYLFQRGEKREVVVQRMVDAQKKILAEIWENRQKDLPISTPEELVILASIVEKETGIGAERAKVAGVFTNRLRQGMKLQSDPTIIYGIFGGDGKPKDRPIYKSDIEKATPYNTYIIEGLPPGPIANPGRAALEAVANPAQTDALFFVADGTGGHAFAVTYEEHQKNVAKWREIEAKRAAEADKAAKQEAEKEEKTE